MTPEALKGKLKRALSLDLPYSKRPIAQKQGAQAAVLILFSLSDAKPQILITRRTEKVESHKGQMAFPGGLSEDVDPDLEATALRETLEETGVSPTIVELLGRLPELSTFTGFRVTPIVGVARIPPEEISIDLNPDELDEAFWVTLEELLAPGVFREEYFPLGKVNYPIPAFQVRNYRIWGATAVMIKNLLDRLDSLG